MPSASSRPPADLRGLYERPGFMIRRAHQIATSIFLDASAPLGATPTQYGVLSVLDAKPGLDQITLARRLGLDRSTAGTVVRTLTMAGHVARSVGPDRRRRTLHLTTAGMERLAALHPPATAAIDRLMRPLDETERSTFLFLLGKVTRAHNEASRVPIFDAEPRAASAKDTAPPQRPQPAD